MHMCTFHTHTYTDTNNLTLAGPRLTFKAFSDKCLATRGGVWGGRGGGFWPSPLCPPTIGPRESISLWAFARLIYVWRGERDRKREKEEDKKKGKSSLTLWPLSRPWAGGRLEPSMPHEAQLRGAFLLCYSNSLVTVLNPRGSLTGALGSQAWLLTAPRWKASDIALSLACYLLP